MYQRLGRIDLVSDLLVLGVRQMLLDELVPSNKKASNLLGGIQESKDCFFTNGPKSSFSAGGWIKDKTGALIANELFRMYSSMFDYREIITSPIKPDKLVKLSIAYNVKYGHVMTVDINKVYSLFVAINNRYVYPAKCRCGTQYIRVDHPNNIDCPWCRVGVKKSLVSKTKSKKQSLLFTTLDEHAKRLAS